MGPENTVSSPGPSSGRCDAWPSCPTATAMFPTHGAGSFCSAPPGADRTSTIGREKGTNALMRIDDEDAFVHALLSSLGTYPPYFSRLAADNREGPGEPGPAVLTPLGAAEVFGLRHQGAGGTTCARPPTTPQAISRVPLAIPLRVRDAARMAPARPGRPDRDRRAIPTRIPRRSSGRPARSATPGSSASSREAAAWATAGEALQATPWPTPRGSTRPPWSTSATPGVRGRSRSRRPQRRARRRRRGHPAGRACRHHVWAQRARRDRRERAGARRTVRRHGHASGPNEWAQATQVAVEVSA